jgi:hypothetical protein
MKTPPVIHATIEDLGAVELHALPAYGMFVAKDPSAEDGEDGLLYYVPMDADGSIDVHDWTLVEFACPHLLAAVNAVLGTTYTMDGFEDDDCACSVYEVDGQETPLCSLMKSQPKPEVQSAISTLEPGEHLWVPVDGGRVTVRRRADRAPRG